MSSLGISGDLLWVVAALFFLVALLYSSVGLGGGSTYTAIMTIIGVHYIMIPTVSLMLNLIVTFVGMINYWRGGYVKLQLIAPFLVTSLPAAYLGGSMHLSRTVFLWLLLTTLVFVVLRIYFGADLAFRFSLTKGQKLLFALTLGIVLGFVAGTVGIGGGIYLVPLMIMFSLASAKEAAAAGAVFIWLNSLSGIIARAQWTNLVITDMVPMLVLVLLGVVIIIAIFFISRKVI
jgi:uncharacterized membrane protein YfcA